jgi:hypothetical protein
VLTENNCIQIWEYIGGGTATASCIITVPSTSLVANEIDIRRAVSFKADQKRNGKRSHSTSGSTLLDNESGSKTNMNGNVGFIMFASNSSLLVVRGDTVRPAFQTISYIENGQILSSIELEKYTPTLLNSNSSSISNAAATLNSNSDVTIVNSSSFEVGSPICELDPIVKKQKISQQNNVDNSSRTLNERLQEVEHRYTSSSQVSLSNIPNSIEVPKVGTLQTLLSQALHTSDNTLLEYIFNIEIKNVNLIRATIERLPAIYVVPLLSTIVTKLQQRPARAQTFIYWLKQLL